ncbi:aminoacyl-tRNA hydrolase [Corynebacterium aquilae]|uniref:Peptidyl-tRNA hydrolase n=1 Tax=Corynebacterium aquilae DSM 44791 TaxID=1431546 RepID=A0A1L7CEY5_9CORY|nr:aminoacyl-tRNA hydrolase [Corynebacterium aquilae]APT84388.1 hypothetical protein CAQU_04100 [Corynebacterium aquilae DSM 44791]
MSFFTEFARKVRAIFAGGTAAPHGDASRPNTAEAVVPQWLIVGLGNPGAQYEATPHNVGYMVVDAMIDGPLEKLPGTKALVRVQEISGTSVALVRSTTYMNESGLAIGQLAKRWDIAPDHVIVIHDELDLPAGTVRLKQGGSENGHNGLKSTTEQLGTRDYVRVRCGIDRPAPGQSVTEHVLGAISFDPETEIDRAARGAQMIVTEGLGKAQNVIHSEK